MEFIIDTAESLKVSDTEISELLFQVYVDGGYTDQERAVTHFEPSAVRKRGLIICAREKKTMTLAGMIIVVYPDSPARIFVEVTGQGNDTEMHLLGVKPEYRGNGLGRMLVDAAVEKAKEGFYSRMLLCTQATMHSAHRIYESSGFIRVPERDFIRGNRNFLYYEKDLDT